MRKHRYKTVCDGAAVVTHVRQDKAEEVVAAIPPRITVVRHHLTPGPTNQNLLTIEFKDYTKWEGRMNNVRRIIQSAVAGTGCTGTATVTRFNRRNTGDRRVYDKDAGGLIEEQYLPYLRDPSLPPR